MSHLGKMQCSTNADERTGCSTLSVLAVYCSASCAVARSGVTVREFAASGSQPPRWCSAALSPLAGSRWWSSKTCSVATSSSSRSGSWQSAAGRPPRSPTRSQAAPVVSEQALTRPRQGEPGGLATERV